MKYQTKTMSSGTTTVKAERLESTPADAMKELTAKVDMLTEAMSQILQLLQVSNGMEPADDTPAEEPPLNSASVSG